MPSRPTEPSRGNADEAALEAAKGAIHGGIKWGTLGILFGSVAYLTSPVFRGLTVQFKVYLWMCPTVIGSMVEADRRLRMYENLIRAERRLALANAREREMFGEMGDVEFEGVKSRDS